MADDWTTGLLASMAGFSLPDDPDLDAPMDITPHPPPAAIYSETMMQQSRKHVSPPTASELYMSTMSAGSMRDLLNRDIADIKIERDLDKINVQEAAADGNVSLLKEIAADKPWRLDRDLTLRSLDRQCNWWVQDGTEKTAMYFAALDGDSLAVKSLVTAGADLNKSDLDGTTPLWIAAFKGHDPVVEVLIQSRANVNQETKFGQIALHWAADKGSDKTVQMMIEAKADVNKVTKNGWTPLYRAARAQHATTSRILIAAGANIEAANAAAKKPETTDLLVEVAGHFQRESGQPQPMYL